MKGQFVPDQHCTVCEKRKIKDTSSRNRCLVDSYFGEFVTRVSQIGTATLWNHTNDCFVVVENEKPGSGMLLGTWSTISSDMRSIE